MMKCWTLLLLLTFIRIACFGQENVRYRVLLIGDAGEQSAAQETIIHDAVQQQLPGKTTAIFLGDNIYPRGMAITGGEAIKKSENILASQYKSLRAANVPVYFIPGNHDWDKSGPNGYKKMQRVNAWFSGQQDSLLQLLPPNVCPGPVDRLFGDSLVLVAIDSEWWLNPLDATLTGLDNCPCKSKDDVLMLLREILLRHKDKLVLFATHHPFTTYGSHGGYFTLKDHLFPLTHLNRYLYLPLPLVGSLYPLLRSKFPPEQDVKHLLYRDMKKRIDEVLMTHPNIVHVAGHEHALQLIQSVVLEVVSGAGAKKTAVKMGKGSLFASGKSGYVMADVLLNNTLRLSFRNLQNGEVKETFVYEKPLVKPGEKLVRVFR